MRIASLLSLLAILTFSCQREPSFKTPEVDPQNPAELSAAIRVWHGVRTTGNPPSTTVNNNAPQLDQQSNNQQLKAIAGRYAIIQPQVTSGDVAGYYLQVNGASQYFKVDYTKPRNVEGRFRNPARKSPANTALHRGMGIDSVGGGTLDSAIVIVIPSNIQPGQFCVTYWAYDPAGNVSNPITACITVSAFGGDASSAYLHGTWQITGVADDTAAGWSPVNGAIDTVFNTGYCINNRVVDTFGTGPGFFEYAAFMNGASQADLSFASNGGLSYQYTGFLKMFDPQLSTCSNYIYETETDNQNLTGAWSFNSTTGKMVIIFEFDDSFQTSPEAYEYQLTKLANNKIYLYDPIDDTWLRMEK